MHAHICSSFNIGLQAQKKTKADGRKGGALGGVGSQQRQSQCADKFTTDLNHCANGRSTRVDPTRKAGIEEHAGSLTSKFLPTSACRLLHSAQRHKRKGFPTETRSDSYLFTGNHDFFSFSLTVLEATMSAKRPLDFLRFPLHWVLPARLRRVLCGEDCNEEHARPRPLADMLELSA